MPIETTTVYTKERLLRFQNYVLASKKPLWIVSAVATAIIAVCAVLTFVLLWDIQGAIKLFGLLLIELCIPLIYIVIPRLSIKKAKNLNAEVHFSFDETAVHTQASSAIGNENASVFYTALHKIGKKDNDLYLFLDASRAFLIDLSTLSAEQVQTLKDLLKPHFKPKKFKWKA